MTKVDTFRSLKYESEQGYYLQFTYIHPLSLVTAPLIETPSTQETQLYTAPPSTYGHIST